MALVFDEVKLRSLTDQGEISRRSEKQLRLEVTTEDKKACVTIYDEFQPLLRFILNNETECCQATKLTYVVNTHNSGVLICFPTEFETSRFHNIVQGAKFNSSQVASSLFDERTDEASAVQYFQFYGYLSQQQNMMQDYIRTSTYQKAMLQNHDDFRDKVVLDVGAGSGILSFFAIQSGAAKVYAIEASSIAEYTKVLVDNNKLQDKIIVIPGKVEEVELPEQVDIIISEPMGYMLFNERMLESYLHAKKWLKPGGKMFPTKGDLHIAPFTDDSLYMEQFNKANFWYQQSFHGVDLTSIRESALQEYLRQPIVDTFDIRICLAKSIKHEVDFLKTHETDLHRIEIPLEFTAHQTGSIHGLAFWFDIAFIGTTNTTWLSTSPTEPLTHWYQVRCLLKAPIFIKAGKKLRGKVTMVANKRQSYDIDMELQAEDSNIKSTNRLDLKNPFFHYTGQQPAAPPSSQTVSPSDSYWNQLQVSPSVVNGYGNVLNVMQSNLIPIVNSDPISHTGVLPGGATHLQQTVQIPSSVGIQMGSVIFQQSSAPQTSPYNLSNTRAQVATTDVGQYLQETSAVLPNNRDSDWFKDQQNVPW
ncbi:histone-arginine methyltransferase CARMER-like isoform X1 [Anneissia japonica]|uniref:histone-arginine methyltransferase CARMER-like isoform X1 n=1 Tax=Anneissia japonica TaxID=1529436 RepID=UPI0014256737|nr:histone-arginine methyltransferase CARMER-like isoform X1 [Anneissia japonica]